MVEPLNPTELAVAHAVWFAIGGPDGQDWLDAQRLARGALEAIEDQGYVVMSRSALDELERQTDPDYEPPYPPSAYEWTWVEDESLPHRGIYGVRRGSEVVCRTNAHKDGYERAKAIADALNRGEFVDV